MPGPRPVLQFCLPMEYEVKCKRNKAQSRVCLLCAGAPGLTGACTVCSSSCGKVSDSALAGQYRAWMGGNGSPGQQQLPG